MDYTKISKKNWLTHCYYHCAGTGILVLNKIRHEVKGYLTPRTFSTLDLEKVIDYDIKVVNDWLEQLKKYCQNNDITNLNILELGPGADLGVGLNFLARGANRYFALDKFKLIDQASSELYDKFINTIATDEKQKNYLEKEIGLFKNNQTGKIQYIADKKFSLQHFLDKKIDLIVSQAAFEHFVDPAQVIKEIGQISKSGTKVVIQIDMMTHSRWIKDVDPQNIYRYSNIFYQLTKFLGSPNRWRPNDYVTEFNKAGFGKIKIVPITVLQDDYIDNLTPHLNKQFRKKEKQMEILDCYLLATKE
ncbi:MAG: methyltransferase domain-containing protein [Candidatus Magasanikbacteria bacterium]|jgi:SAM-dependent methyltransferase